MLSVCLIVKNEELNLRYCLESIKDIAGEIIIVDTGSTDSTIEIAKDFTSKIINFKWNDNFSDARNESIKEASGDWILFLDADERIDKDDCISLQKLLSSTNFNAIYFRLNNYSNGKFISSSSVLRAFTNNKKLKFQGKIHEQIRPSVETIYGKDVFYYSDIKILHHTNSDRSKQNDRNLKLLFTYPNEDKNSYYYYSLANQYYISGLYNLSISNYKKALQMNDFKVTSHHAPYLIINLMKNLLKCENFAELINVFDKYISDFEDFKDMYFLSALAFIEIGKTRFALKNLYKYKSITFDNLKYPKNNFEDNYNLDNLLQALHSTNIPDLIKTKNLLNIAIILKDENYDITNSIITLNDIADELTVYDISSNNKSLKKLNDFGIKTISTSANDLNTYKFKNPNCKWFITLYDSEVFSQGEQWLLIDSLINSSKYKSLSFKILDLEDNSIKNEIRALQTSSITLDSMKSYNENCKNSNLIIYKEEF